MSGGGLRVDASNPSALNSGVLALSSDAETAAEYGQSGLNFRVTHLGQVEGLNRYADLLAGTQDFHRESLNENDQTTRGTK